MVSTSFGFETTASKGEHCQQWSRNKIYFGGAKFMLMHAAVVNVVIITTTSECKLTKTFPLKLLTITIVGKCNWECFFKL